MVSKKDPNIFELAGQSILRGESAYVDIEVARLYDFTELSIPVFVKRGKRPGPVFFLSGAIHGDEIIGPEIIKRLLGKKKFEIKRGTLICIPIVNVFGYNSRSRYLPDRRDLNRCFPGSSKGSLGARLADIFLENIVAKSNFGIDLHSGAVHRANFPQIRACLENTMTEKLAKAFGASVILDSKLRDGSLRAASEELGVPILVFEGGEALRYDEKTIKLAIRGILRCLKFVGMIEKDKKTSLPVKKAFVAKSSYWLRAPHSGTIRNLKSLGASVKKNETIATVSDVFAKNKSKIKPHMRGVIIGENRLPLVNQGDALFHIATFDPVDLNKISEDMLAWSEEDNYLF